MPVQNLKGKTFYSGLSGLQLLIPKYQFPPPFENASRLTYYASFFNSIEINSSFYKIPKPATVAKWADAVATDFRFTFKLWKGITHNRGLVFAEEDVVAFFAVINAVAHRNGCVLIQFPPSLDRDYWLQLDKLLSCIHKADATQGWKVAVEFRNKSWYHEKVYDLLGKHHAALVVQDIPKSSTPDIEHSADFMYIRFHGPSGNYRDSYSEDFLREYASYVREWMDEGKTVYVYFNNTAGDAFNNLISLKEEIGVTQN